MRSWVSIRFISVEINWLSACGLSAVKPGNRFLGHGPAVEFREWGLAYAAGEGGGGGGGIRVIPRIHRDAGTALSW